MRGLQLLPENFDAYRQDIEKALDDCAGTQGEKALRPAVDNFRQIFGKLPLWERIKDFFGLSNTADNQRNMTVLCIIDIFHQYCNTSQMQDEQRHQLTQTLVRVLQDSGLVPWQENTTLETLTAYCTTRLLTQNPSAIGISLDAAALTPDPESGAVSLAGTVMLGEPVNISLPFEARADTPLYALTEMYGGEGGATLRALYEALPPETRVALQLLYEQQHEGGGQVLFSRHGVLGELNQLEPAEPASTDRPQSTEWPELFNTYGEGVVQSGPEFVRWGLKAVSRLTGVEYISTRDELSVKRAESQESLHSGTTSAVVENEVPFGPLRGGAMEFLQDSPRMMNHITICVNGRDLSSQTIRDMQDVAKRAAARTPETSNFLTKIRGQGFSDAWARLIKADLNISDEYAREIAAAAMYAGRQSGPGALNTGELANLGPHRSGEKSQRTVLNIHLDDNGDMHVIQAEFSTGNYDSESRFTKTAWWPTHKTTTTAALADSYGRSPDFRWA